MSGSIKQRPNGKWRARYRDENRKEHAAHFNTRREAQRWLDEVTASKITSMYVDPNAGKISFKKFYDDWSERQIWESNTRETMNLAARAVPFHDLALNAIRRSHIEAWVKAMQSAGLKPATIGTRFRCVARTFKAAVDDRVIAIDPAKGVRLPHLRRQEAAMKIPTPEEARAILEAADEDFTALLGLIAFAGLRPAEANSIQVGDIDWTNRTLRISRQVQRGAIGAGVEVRSPKYGSERTVYVPDDLLIMLSDQTSRRSLTVNNHDAWLFVGKDETMPPRQNTLAVRWQRTCRRAGVEGFTPHSLRHFYASALIANGCDVVTVSRAMGHRNPSITLKVYAHLWPTAADRTRTAAANLMASVAAADSLRTADTASGSD
jgi:integrase